MHQDEVKQYFEDGFKPYHCSATVEDFAHVISFSIFDDNDKTIIKVHKLRLGSILTKNRLEKLINQYRQEIRQKGFNI